ncbi:MAG TPA: carbohydrate kinase family protein [Candidatus Thermoplasmatota archaeon]|nr:carbohydrate kinase family protein [Candidatus Thermoplasmatota archaeon]
MAALALRVADRLESARPGDFHVVALPDFFLDHIVVAPPWSDATSAMQAVHARGGGNVPGWPQRFAPGGNAANTALAVARLGARSHLVARTDAFGLAYLRETIGPLGVDLKQVRDDGDLAITTALEFGEERRNVMLSWAGSVADLRPEHLDDNQLTLVQGSDAVVLANWTANRGGGTELFEHVLKSTGGGRTLAYVDTGDPSARLADVPDLKRRVFAHPDLDVLALNENELRLFSGVPGVEAGRAALRREVAPDATLDVHTSEASWTAGPHGETSVPAFRVRFVRATGAGDVWNAGNLLGHLLDLAPDERLLLANATAAIYVSGTGPPPRLADVVAWLRSGPAFQ